MGDLSSQSPSKAKLSTAQGPGQMKTGISYISLHQHTLWHGPRHMVMPGRLLRGLRASLPGSSFLQNVQGLIALRPLS